MKKYYLLFQCYKYRITQYTSPGV